MQFGSLQALITMDGHGAYVWSSYAAFVLVVMALVMITVFQRRRIIAQHRRLMRLEAQRHGNGGSTHDARGS